MYDLSRVAQADAQVVGALQDLRKDAQQPLEGCDGVGGLTLRRDSSQNLALGAEDRGPFAPLGEATCPWQCRQCSKPTKAKLSAFSFIFDAKRISPPDRAGMHATIVPGLIYG